MKNNNTTYSRCTLHDEFNFLMAPADFKKIYQREYTVPKPGVYFVEEEPPLQVTKNQVVGWSRPQASGGAISYSDFTGSEASEFIYTTTATQHKADDFFFLRSEEPQVSKTKHFISAHIIESAYFHLQHNYTSTGAYLITSNLTKPLHVYVDEELDEIQLNCPHTIFTFADFDIQIADHAGSNISYLVDLQAGENKHYFRSKEFGGFQYKEPGIYTILVTGSNSVSKLVSYCTVKVLDDITGFDFDGDIQPAELGAASTIKWSLRRGTNVTYNIDYGDGESDSVYISHRSSVSQMHTYPTFGRYNVTIQAMNILGTNKIIRTVAIVDKPINGIELFTQHRHITDNIQLTLNEEFKVHVNISSGSNVQCVFMFGDNFNSSERIERTFTKAFQEPGNYIVSVTCRNAVSEKTTRLPLNLIVEELVPIQDLAIDLKGGTSLGSNTLIRASMSQGTAFTCLLDLGDGHQITTDKSTFTDLVTHRYLSVGTYNIYLRCTNNLGNVDVEQSMDVNIPLAGLGVVCPEEIYFKVGELIYIYIGVLNGSRVASSVVYGDGAISMFSVDAGITVGLNHTYSKPGEYQIKVTAGNDLNQLNESCNLLFVEHPITSMDLITNSPLKLRPGVAIFELTVQMNFPLPTNAIIHWRFGDDSPLAIDDFRTNSSNNFTKRYGYQQKGVYKSIVIVFNNVSKISFNRLIDVQEIVPPELGFFVKTKEGDLNVGRGKQNKVFVHQETVYVNVTKQEKDLSYEFDFGDDKPAIKTSSNFIEYTYSSPGHYNVSVEVTNQLELLNAEGIIIIQQPLRAISINLNDILSLNKPVEFILNSTQFGTEVCGYIDFGDNITYVIDKENCNETKIRDIGVSSIVRYHSSVGSNLTLKHVYTSKGYFNITVHLENAVSRYHGSKKVLVEFRPCPNPSVVMLGGGFDVESPRNIKSSAAVQLRSEVECVCPSAVNITFNWEIFQEKDNVRVFHRFQQSPFPLARKLVEIPDPRLLTIPQNLLEIGRHRVDLSVSFVGLDTDLSEVVTKNSTWLIVKPSNLKATIQGKKKIITYFMRISYAQVCN